MKKIDILIPLMIALFAESIFAVSIKSIESKIELLKQSRDTAYRVLPITYDPFYKGKSLMEEAKPKTVVTKKVKKASKKLQLLAIFNNRAFINSKWYKEGDKIGGYKVQKIKDTFVILSKKGKTIILRIGKKNILKIKEKTK